MQRKALEDIMEIAHETDVLIGLNREAMIGLLYLRAEPTAGVVEIRGESAPGTEERYEGLARKLRFRHGAINLRNSSVIDDEEISRIANVLRRVVREVAHIRHRDAKARRRGLYLFPPETQAIADPMSEGG
ncbi:hypothetical protein HDU96_008017 [Phlyctochytrium bullatum]|nr:hypothetical protein HDU96_008017 [Phlyctochytrium bullatum]